VFGSAPGSPVNPFWGGGDQTRKKPDKRMDAFNKHRNIVRRLPAMHRSQHRRTMGFQVGALRKRPELAATLLKVELNFAAHIAGVVEPRVRVAWCVSKRQRLLCFGPCDPCGSCVWPPAGKRRRPELQ
jgi:hypothetical protein